MFKIDIFAFIIYEYITDFCSKSYSSGCTCLCVHLLGSRRFALLWGQLVDVSNSKESCYEKQFTDRTATFSNNTLFSLSHSVRSCRTSQHIRVSLTLHRPQGAPRSPEPGALRHTHTCTHKQPWLKMTWQPLGPAVCACSVCEKRLCRET